MTRVTPEPGLADDDLQKGRWGGRSVSRGRRLRAVYLGGNRDGFDSTLVVESIDGSPLEGPFYFHLHQTFRCRTYVIRKVRRERYAAFEEIRAYETFTAAVEVMDRRGDWVGLELDLEEVPSIPLKYKPVGFRLQRASVSERVTARAPVLQRLISGNVFLKSPVDWRAAWVKAERWVCRIRLGAKVLGTGVLVGKNVVLTNWHVIEQVPANAPGSALQFEFDYAYGFNMERPQPFLRNASDDWLLDHGDCTPAERDGVRSKVLPKPAELDFALVRLAEAVDPLGAGRSFAQTPPVVTYEKGDGLIILQHPRGDPQCFSVDPDGVIGLNKNGTRLKYSTSTEAGASGAPCFDMDWQFTALHQAGFCGWPARGAYNQGIPINPLRPHIAAAVDLVG